MKLQQNFKRPPPEYTTGISKYNSNILINLNLQLYYFTSILITISKYNSSVMFNLKLQIYYFTSVVQY